MNRRNFVASVLASSVATPTLMAQHGHDTEHHNAHDTEQLSGPQANATVSFGAWLTDPPLNRFNMPTPVTANHHHQLPFEVEVKVGGSVNFVISGFHVLGIYAPRTKPHHISLSAADQIPIPGAPPNFPAVIDDPLNRVYWGSNPFALVPPGSPPSQDRIENVTFGARGTYLVICTFTPHFNVDEKMYGYVKVVR